MNGRVAKLLRKIAQHHPSDKREYHTQKHEAMFPIQVRQPDGLMKTEWMPRVSYQNRCTGKRYNYLQSKLYYTLIRQGRASHASDMFNRRKGRAVKDGEGKSQDSPSHVQAEKAELDTDRATNESSNQEA